ncbi:F0F1 ATP synthase subunit epsilon [Halonatronum saccharophilum]|uniref:F0F1 ATP synthase subunit epsilon n=1 Tax=Halonatronum saccharophilum TaxID=150060 RepID=UPI0004843802|nr:F0F1 ATP synthase subunit epsilon [Halonatronum saccharophilum]
MSKMKVNVITPEKVVYDKEASMIVVRTIDGNRGIMPNHQALVTGVDIGELKIKDGEEESILALSKGYMEVRPQEVNILVDTAEFSHEIDEERAKEAKDRAQERLAKGNEINHKRAEIALRKAINRLKVGKGRNFE